MYQLDHNSAHLLSTRLNSVFKSLARSACFWEQSRLSITTRSISRTLILCWRKVSRIIRLIRLRSAAPDKVRLLTIIPSLALLPPFRTKNTLKCWSARLSACMARSNPSLRNNRCATVNLIGELDSEPCTTLGATRIDNCAATACLHSHQKAVGAFSFGYGRLICAFHVFPRAIRKTRYYKALWHICQVHFAFLLVDKFRLAL